MLNKALTKNIIYMIAIGDALGVPVEFYSREELDKDPVFGYREFGTYQQPAGTWSDDTAFTLATFVGLNKAMRTGAQKLDEWNAIMYDVLAECMDGRFWQDGELFDIGHATYTAIQNRQSSSDERSNGNGALMRIMGLFPFIYNEKGKEYDAGQIDLIRRVTSLTHGTELTGAVNIFYLELARRIMEQPNTDYYNLVQQTVEYCHHRFGAEMDMVASAAEKVTYMSRDEVKSGGYCLDALVAALYCLLKPGDSKEKLLKAVNLGSDTDTTAAVLGGLLGIREELHSDMVAGLRHKEIIDDVVEMVYA
ncbi:MAG: ADP-ribosylglycohydrolase family protein [Clostridiales bacterium]|nr:ADP-ribosylglycohydrolase family protein [Clostridiales bacterium]